MILFQIELGDGLPMMICEQCIYELIVVNNFIQMCKKTDKSLRQYVFNDNSNSLEALQSQKNLKPSNITFKSEVIQNDDFDDNTDYSTFNNYCSENVIENNTISNNNNSTKIKNEFDSADNTNQNKTNKFERRMPPLILRKTQTVEKNLMMNNTIKSSDLSRKLFSEKNDIIQIKKEYNQEKICEVPPLIFNINKIENSMNSENKLSNNNTTERKMPPLVYIKSIPKTVSPNSLCIAVQDKNGKITNLIIDKKKTKCIDKNNIMLNNSYLNNFQTEENIGPMDPFDMNDNEESGSENDEFDPDQFLPTIKPKKKPSLFWKCRTCNATFPKSHLQEKKDEYKAHVNSHYGNAGIWCEICPRRVSSEFYLENHNKYNHRRRGYKCRKCNIWYKDHESYLEHRKEVHGKGATSFTCEYCEKVFKTKLGHLRHIKMHMGTLGEYPCDMCDKKYTEEYHLLRHKKRKHEIITRYLCMICGKQFYELCELRKHEYTHFPDERPLISCELCGKGWANRTSYYRHKVIAHEKKLDRRFECSICKQKFLFKTALNQHMKRHDKGIIFLTKIKNCNNVDCIIFVW